MKTVQLFGVLATVSLTFLPFGAPSADMTDQATALVEQQIRPWLSDPRIVDAVKAQNVETAGLGQGEIDALDGQWRSETTSSSRPLIDSVIGKDVSDFLVERKAEGQGLYSELIVMDARGLNVGLSDVTSDYWQGDEAKWQQTFPVGPDAIHVGDVEFDESTQTFQVQISLVITDGGVPIGALTAGIDAEALQ